MNESGGDDEFVLDLRMRLREAEEPDAVLRARLSVCRARAIGERPGRPLRTWTTAGVALAASVAAAMVIFRPHAGPDVAGQDELAQGEMFELLLDDDPVLEAELYEDLDVLTWLVGEDERV